MGRNFVVCCDGTWNTPTQTDRGSNVPSNVVKMARAVLTGAMDDQIVSYDSGVGTGRGLDKWTGGALGIGLTENIKEAYRKIVEEFRGDDTLYLFGFSRGAYTVRSLAGLIGRCGLVRDAADIDKAYDLYRKCGADNVAGRSDAAEFKSRQRAIGIHFLGVWDTVGALGVPAISKYGLLRKAIRLVTDNTALAHGFHDETLGTHVLHAYHALAIDERRGPFAPSIWKVDPAQPARPNVEQVWFAGVHSNIGGGYVDSGLSDHAFMWMAVKAMNAGLRLDEQYLALRVDPNAHGEMRDEYHGLYKVMTDHIRKICDSETLNEKMHRSVEKRMIQPTNSYHPKNVVDARPAPAYTDEGLAVIEKIRSNLYRMAGGEGPAATALNIEPIKIRPSGGTGGIVEPTAPPTHADLSRPSDSA